MRYGENSCVIFVEMDHEEPQTKKHPQIYEPQEVKRFLSAVTQGMLEPKIQQEHYREDKCSEPLLSTVAGLYTLDLI